MVNYQRHEVMSRITVWVYNLTSVAVVVYALWVMFFVSPLEFSLVRIFVASVAGWFLLYVFPFGNALIPILWERWWLGLYFTQVSSFGWALAIAAAIGEAMLFFTFGSADESRRGRV